MKQRVITAVIAIGLFIPVLFFLPTIVLTVVCGLLMKKPKLKWLGEYALPISLIAGMAAAIPLTVWLS